MLIKDSDYSLIFRSSGKFIIGIYSGWTQGRGYPPQIFTFIRKNDTLNCNREKQHKTNNQIVHLQLYSFKR